MPDLLKDLTHTEALIVGGGFAGLGGSLSYLLKMYEGKPFKVGEFILHIAISAFFGLIAFEVCAYFGLKPEYCGAASGMAGWFGTRVARIAEIVVRKRLGITKEDMNQ